MQFNIIIVIFVKDSNQFYSLSGSWCEKFAMMIICPWSFKPKFNRLRHSVKDYYCAKFQVIPIRGFRFIIPTHSQNHLRTDVHTNTHTSRHIAISAAPYYVVRVDNNNIKDLQELRRTAELSSELSWLVL